MAVPKKKTSVSRRGHRRAHKSLDTLSLAVNATDGNDVRPHHVSRDGHYNGRQVTDKVVNY